MNRSRVGASLWLAVVVALPSLVSAAPVGAQASVRPLSTPTARLEEPFSQVVGVRELSDGRVIVVDSREMRITLADLSSGATRALSRTGQGPGEYTLPIHIHILADDTTFVQDMLGRGRGVMIVRDSVVSQVPQYPGATPDDPAISYTADQVDLRGFVYSHARPQSRGTTRPDSTPVERLERATGRRDVIVRFDRRMKSPIAPPPTPAGPGGMRRAGKPIPFASFNRWTVSGDGRVAIVGVEPYQVFFIAPDGRRTVGPQIPFQPVRVTAREKEMWREEQRRPRATIHYEGGGRTRAGSQSYPVEEPERWPEVLPSFIDEPRFATDGTLWIHRAVAAGAPPTFDVIDHAGRLSHQVTLPPRARLVGFGNGTLYLVRLDEDDLQYLERHPIPR